MNEVPAKHRDLVFLLREEPIGDSALIEDLDGAREQTTCARAGEILVGAPFDNREVDPRQRQLTRQHQPRGTASGYHHRMFGHSHDDNRAMLNVAIIASTYKLVVEGELSEMLPAKVLDRDV